MKGKKIYSAPTFLEIVLDEEISLLMTSVMISEESAPVDRGGKVSLGDTQGSSSFESTQVDDSGIKENPFR